MHIYTYIHIYIYTHIHIVTSCNRPRARALESGFEGGGLTCLISFLFLSLQMMPTLITSDAVNTFTSSAPYGISYGHEQALVSLQIKKTVKAGVGRTFAVIIEGG